MAPRLFFRRVLNNFLYAQYRMVNNGKRNINAAYRTHTCGELQAKHDGQEVTLCGWIVSQRFTKFLVLRDGYGSVQVLLDQCDPSLSKYVISLPMESVVQVKGIAQKRPKHKINKEMATGEVEVNLKEVKLLGICTPDIPYTGRDLDKVGDVPKLKYRYLYLRRKEIQDNLRTRARIVLKMMEYLSREHDFVEVKTPTLSRQSPGGAKEFLVSSDIPGKFYALSQSPQQFKQMLMVSRLEKYYQIATCYRNEGTKSDRQPEFTQVDIEASFVTAEDVKYIVEGLLKYSWPEEKPELCIPFPCMTYKSAMHQYGTDKPDLRYDMKLKYLTEELRGQGIEIFDRAISEKDSVVAAIVVPSGSKHISKSQLKDLKDKAELFSQNLLDIQIKKDLTWNSVLAKRIPDDLLHKLNSILEVKPLDLVLMSAGKYRNVVPVLGKMRVACAELLESAGAVLFQPNDFRFLWGP